MKDLLKNVPKKRKNFLFPVCTDRMKQRIEKHDFSSSSQELFT